jgi:hypothetical protein
MRLAIVEWEDAQSVRKWEEMPTKCPIMRSVGYLSRGKNYHLVVSLLDPDNCGQVSTIIPNGCVKKVRRLICK